MVQAKEQGKAVTLFASSMGERVYSRLRFRMTGVVTVQVQGEEEKVQIPGMVWDGKLCSCHFPRRHYLIFLQKKDGRAR